MENREREFEEKYIWTNGDIDDEFIELSIDDKVFKIPQEPEDSTDTTSKETKTVPSTPDTLLKKRAAMQKESTPASEQEHYCPRCLMKIDSAHCGVFFSKASYRVNEETVRILANGVDTLNQCCDDAVETRGVIALVAGYQERIGGAAFFRPSDSMEIDWSENYPDEIYNKVVFDKKKPIATLVGGSMPKESEGVMCHNCGYILPKDWFKTPSTFIALGGHGGSGKTVALLSFLDKYTNKDINAHGMMLKTNLKQLKNKVNLGRIFFEDKRDDFIAGIMPEVTVKSVMIPPIILEVSRPGKHHSYIALCDISGETYQQELNGIIQTGLRIGDICDSYFFCLDVMDLYEVIPDGHLETGDDNFLVSPDDIGVDSPSCPKQRDIFNVSFIKDDKLVTRTEKLNNFAKMLNIMVSDNMGVAIVFTKTDKLKNASSQNAKNVYNLYNTPSTGKWDVVLQKSDIYRQTAFDVSSIREAIVNLKDVEYFAISATGKEPKEGIKPEPNCVEEPFFWLIFRALDSQGVF